MSPKKNEKETGRNKTKFLLTLKNLHHPYTYASMQIS